MATAKAGSVSGRILLRFLKGFFSSVLAVFVAALTFMKDSYIPGGTWETLLWKTVVIGVLTGVILALEKFRKILGSEK